MQTAQRIRVEQAGVNGVRLSPDLNEASSRGHRMGGRRREAKRAGVSDHSHQKVFGARHINLAPAVVGGDEVGNHF